MDLSKAFDTVDKEILKQKLYELGLSDISIELINSYMSNRQFCFSNDSDKHYDLKYGVPQGSILGPLLFIAYTYDMINITMNNKVIVYADDTTVIVTGRNITEAKQHCNDVLERFYNYFTYNRLSINPSKTKYIIYKPIFKSQKNLKKLTDTLNTDLVMGNTILEQVRSIKFLGIIVNDKLTWDLHKKHIQVKVNKTLGILYRSRTIMDQNNLINMYKTFIEPYFLYGIEVWGHSVKSQSDTIIKLQNKVVRIIYSCQRTTDAWKHDNGRTLTIQNLYNKVIYRICYKHHAKLLPKHFLKEIMPKIGYYNENRPERTRLSMHLYVQLYRTNKYTNTTCFQEKLCKSVEHTDFGF